MLCFCPYSNTNYRTDNFKGRWKAPIRAPHPIFYAPVEHLLNRAGDLIANRLEPQESRLLFLALLNSTGRIKWEAAADPTAKLVLTYSEPMIRWAHWQANVHAPTLELPSFVVRHDNRSLANIGGWLDALFAAKEAWELQLASRHLRKKLDGIEVSLQQYQEHLSGKEAALERLLKSSTRKDANYAMRLASWAMEAASVPDSIRQLWTEIFSLSGLALYSDRYSLTDFTNLRQWMEDELDALSSPLFVHAVLYHVRKLEGVRARGLDYWLGLEEAGSASDSLEAEANTFKILDDSVESFNISKTIAKHAPLTEPVASSYPSRAPFILARSAWLLAESKRTALDELLRRKLAADQEDRLDMLHLADSLEDAAAEDAADGRQAVYYFVETDSEEE